LTLSLWPIRHAWSALRKTIHSANDAFELSNQALQLTGAYNATRGFSVANKQLRNEDASCRVAQWTDGGHAPQHGRSSSSTEAPVIAV